MMIWKKRSRTYQRSFKDKAEQLGNLQSVQIQLQQREGDQLNN